MKDKGLLEVVVGGQYGSEGKGAVAAYLAKGREELMVVRVAGPNAGHSALDANGRKWALRHIPVAAVTNLQAKLVIAAGSEIDEEVLAKEIQDLENDGIAVRERLYVDGQATVIEQVDKDYETELVAGIGSTGKGIGSARARRAMREAPLWMHWPEESGSSVFTSDTQWLIRHHLRLGGDVIIEGTQGFALGLHAGLYPHCTSSDCRAIDFLAMAGVSPWADYVHRTDVWVCLRTYPIRVAGPSGPMQGETTWEELEILTDGHIQPELTTVTQKVRRVGEWDPALAKAAIEANGGPGAVRVALMFFDYWYPELSEAEFSGELVVKHLDRLREVEDEIGVWPELLGTSPGTIVDWRDNQ